MTQAQTKFSHKFYAFQIMRVINRTRGRSYECKMCFLKINRLLELRRLISNLFHSVIVDEKNFLKKLRFLLKKGKLETFLVVYNKCLTEIKLRSY